MKQLTKNEFENKLINFMRELPNSKLNNVFNFSHDIWLGIDEPNLPYNYETNNVVLKSERYGDCMVIVIERKKFDAYDVYFELYVKPFTFEVIGVDSSNSGNELIDDDELINLVNAAILDYTVLTLSDIITSN